MDDIRVNDTVRHARDGQGRVIGVDGEVIYAHLDDGVNGYQRQDLTRVLTLTQKATEGRIDDPLKVLLRILAGCIRSVNDAWGVFSGSRITLLPHQLWVCKRVLETWPTRWLVADDVGLGKTIEAGLILTPLLSAKRVRRLLILTPAGLVDQWQERLREMFDIRLIKYTRDQDTPRADFWNGARIVVASLHTLRAEGDHQNRLMAADPWDLVLVDEAHHLNADEQGGKTLGYKLLERMTERNRIDSMVFFTGTPHRGKDYGFLSLLSLLRPKDFDPKRGLSEQTRVLREVMIRNNKINTTDMRGERIFHPIHNYLETYTYSDEEADFYNCLTEFIREGKAWASGLSPGAGSAVALVLTTMQKLASSSVAAIRKAVGKRLEKARAAAQTANDPAPVFPGLGPDDEDLDTSAQRDETRLQETAGTLSLVKQEISALEDLLAKANRVTKETKVVRIMEIIDDRFRNQSVLLYTEYKATQALVVTTLQKRYGTDTVVFINGDDYLDLDAQFVASGQPTRIYSTRHDAAMKFNSGRSRFLVSTEAAGEGVDLQRSCHALIHVDLPWNPMRMHQRVGRLSRYGQSKEVDVISVRNPDTVESRIWELLDEKLERITQAFAAAMDDPEDMRQLVLGMASSQDLEATFFEADPSMDTRRLRDWFNERTATFGGETAVNTVREIFGNVARFDFGTAQNEIPKVDVPDLLPFVKTILTAFKKRPTQDAGNPHRLSFSTPAEWRKDFRIADRYSLVFSRGAEPDQEADPAGVGTAIIDHAVETAGKLTESLAILGPVNDDALGELVAFTIRDRVTADDSTVGKIVVVGMRRDAKGTWNMLRDWELLRHINDVVEKPRAAHLGTSDEGTDGDPIPAEAVSEAKKELEKQIVSLGLNFISPRIEELAYVVSRDMPPRK